MFGVSNGLCCLEVREMIHFFPFCNMVHQLKELIEMNEHISILRRINELVGEKDMKDSKRKNDLKKETRYSIISKQRR